MKALFFDGLIPHLIEKYQTPEPGEDEALIRVLMAGICATDIEIMKGYKGFKGVPGHEFVGLVEQVNGGYRGLIGKRVVGEINIGCGECEYCAKGLKEHCPSRNALGISEKDGAFAEYLTLPLKNLWEVPQNLSDEEAVFTEPLAAAFQILEQAHLKPTDRIAILGDGKLGLLIAFVLFQAGLDVVLVGRHESKLSIGARQKIKTKELQELVRRPAFSVVVEATGSVQGLEDALAIVKPKGLILLKTTFAPTVSAMSARGNDNARATSAVPDLNRVVVDEIQIVGSRCGPFPPALSTLAKGRINVKPLISAVYPFGEILSAFEKSQEESVLKVLVDFRGTE
jgi:threonine dehydrogenase-like Zn-dependent dehydrogenase